MKKFFKKILIKFPTIFYKINKKELLNNIDWIKKLFVLYNIFRRYFRVYNLPIFLDSYAKEIEKNIEDNDRDSFFNNIVSNFEKLDDNSKMFLLYILFYSKLITNDIVEKYMKFAQKTENENFRYWFTMDISKITFLLQKGFYDNYYIDRKQLLKQIAEDCNFKLPKKTQNNNSNKLCIITYCLEPTVFNSVQRVAMMISKGLNKYFDEIMIVSLESFALTKEEKKEWNTPFYRPFSIYSSKENEEMFEKNAKISFVQIGNYKERYQQALNIIYDYNPSVILDMSDEYSIISYYYSKDFKTFYLPLRNDVSSSFFNYTLGRKWKYEMINKNFKSVDLNCVCDWSFPEYVPKAEKKYSRKDINIYDNSFVIMTIGNNDKVIDNLLADKMCKLLNNNKEFVWLLVGGDAPKYIHKKFQKLFDNGQIIERGFENNLAGLCAVGDIVLRPNTTGSSGATAIAAQQGLPIVMTNFLCDPMRWLGVDYSDITNYDDLMLEILKLYRDKQYYNKIKNIVLHKVNNATNEEKSWKELNEIMRKMK